MAASLEFTGFCMNIFVFRSLSLLALLGVGLAGAAQPIPGRVGAPFHAVRMEVFGRGDSELSARAQAYAEELGRRTRGLEIAVHDVLKDRQQLSRLWSLARRAGREKPVVPAFYCCDRLYFGFTDARQTGPSIENLLTADVYTRSTCPRCIAAKAFINGLKTRWPAIRFRIYEITYDVAARQRYEELCRSQGKIPGLPTISFAGRVMIGYQGDHITGAQLENLIRQVAGTAEPSRSSRQGALFNLPGRDRLAAIGLAAGQAPGAWLLSAALPAPMDPVSAQEHAVGSSPGEPPPPDGPPPSDGPPATEEVPDFEEVPFPEEMMLPEEAGPSETGQATIDPMDSASEIPPDLIELPVLGQLRASELGLPIFTFLVGLVDGFNPCAMWILVFLLSVLVNIKDRRKILLIAGTFVVVSGLAYFAFMAAWLNLFLLIGIARKAQVILGLLAILIGTINIKDFFAFKQGVSLSIPESSKPGLYRRVREIVSAEYVTAALAGVVVLAVIVNMIELLCTAGLPALYTQILTMHELPLWKNYAYLALYIVAYMLDDTMLLAVVVATLSHRKLQEREGRWLKLISGLVILALGLVMIFKPAWLQLGH